MTPTPHSQETPAKGDFKCRCECCVYWRRHVHRLVASRDKAHADRLWKLGMYRTLYEGAEKTSAKWFQEVRRLRAELRARDKHGWLTRWLRG